jgi:AraC-like DNA-binding protein
MSKSVPLRPRDYRHIDDALHEALFSLEDLKWGPWWFRCVEFHFGKGHYVIGDHFGWHLHKELQLEIPLDGEFQFATRSSSVVKVKRGQVYAIPPDAVHRWKCTRAGLMIGISLAVMPHADSVIQPPGTALTPVVIEPHGLPSMLENLMQELNHEDRPREFAGKRLTCWMYLLITQILGAFAVPSVSRAEPVMDASPASRSQRVVSKIVRFIDANLAGDLTVSRFAREFGLSTRQIHRLFIDATGVSCHRYVMDRRLEAARSLLQAQAHLSIKEVAHASGFASTAHFSSKFKSAHGLSPSDFRGQQAPGVLGRPPE